MKIIADENIPHASEAFAALGEVISLPGRNMTATDVHDCDCLLVRSITPVNRQLLQGSSVRFVASATIGTDHIDLDYLHANQIGFANAPGCNAESAAGYMINALFHLAEKKGFDPFSLTAGIVGYGNVGSRVKNKLDALGIDCLINDPPRQDAGDDSVNYVSLQTILHECDLVTLHVPLTRDGEYPTYHLFDAAVLDELGNGAVLFNAARGPVIDNPALSALLQRRNDLTVFLDTWEGEPAINQQLMRQVDLGTPHIAGYSVEGKLRGTQMIMDAACAYFDCSTDWNMQQHLPQMQLIEPASRYSPDLWFDLFRQHYPVENDHLQLLRLAAVSHEELSLEFDRLRKHYPRRYEYSHYLLQDISDNELQTRLRRLCFELAE